MSTFCERFQLGKYKRNVQNHITTTTAHLNHLQTMSDVINSTSGHEEITDNLLYGLSQKCDGARAHLDTLQTYGTQLDVLGNLCNSDHDVLLACQSAWGDPDLVFVSRMLDHSGNIISMAGPVLQDTNLSDLQKQTFLSAINMHTTPTAAKFFLIV